MDSELLDRIANLLCCERERILSVLLKVLESSPHNESDLKLISEQSKRIARLKAQVTKPEKASAQKPEPKPKPTIKYGNAKLRTVDVPGFDPGQAMGSRYNVSARRAHERGLPWLISPTVFAQLSEFHCSYCGEPTGSGSGLDRIDNAKGYEIDNVLPCCGLCNLTRGSRLSVDEMRAVSLLRQTSETGTA